MHCNVICPSKPLLRLRFSLTSHNSVIQTYTSSTRSQPSPAPIILANSIDTPFMPRKLPKSTHSTTTTTKTNKIRPILPDACFVAIESPFSGQLTPHQATLSIRKKTQLPTKLPCASIHSTNHLQCSSILSSVHECGIPHQTAIPANSYTKARASAFRATPAHFAAY